MVRKIRISENYGKTVTNPVDNPDNSWHYYGLVPITGSYKLLTQPVVGITDDNITDDIIKIDNDYYRVALVSASVGLDLSNENKHNENTTYKIKEALNSWCTKRTISFYKKYKLTAEDLV